MLFIYRSNLNDIAVSGAQCRLYRYHVKKRTGQNNDAIDSDPEITFLGLFSDVTRDFYGVKKTIRVSLRDDERKKKLLTFSGSLYSRSDEINVYCKVALTDS